MKKFMIFMLLGLAVLSGRAYGDNGELNFSSNNPQNSLIADCPDLSVSVLYEDLGGISYFYIRKYGNTVDCLKFEVPYKGFIKDMECYGKYLYFCGTNTMEGVIGFFDIESAMNVGFADYYFCYLQQSSPYLTQITSVNKLALFPYSTGQNIDIHLAFVADMDIPGAGTGTTVGEAYYDGVQWHVEYDYNKGCYNKFCDITTTQNLVIAVGSRDDQHRYFLKAWKQTTNFLSTFPTPNYVEALTSGLVLNGLLITKLNGDQVAVAYPYYKNPIYSIRTETWKYSSGFYCSSTTLLQSSIVPHLYSLSYAPANNKVLYSLYIQNSQLQSSINHTIATLDYSSTPPQMELNHYLMNEGPYHCVCGYNQSGYQCSGIFSSTFDMFFDDNGPTSTGPCESNVSFNVNTEDITYNEMMSTIDIVYPLIIENHVQKPLITSMLNIHCYNN